MRVRWIDIAKGIGIILVTMGHSRLSGTSIGPWITSFHMPLFFVLAGVCFDETRYPTYGAYAKRKAKALLYPYVGLSFFVAVLFALFCFDCSEKYSADTLFWNMLHGDTIGPFWFIPVLLWVELAYGLVVRVIVSWWGRLLFCLCCYIIGINLTTTGTHEFFVNTIFVSMLYYGIGCTMAKLENIRLSATRVLLIGGGFALVHIGLLKTVYPYYAEYVNCKFGNPALSIFVAMVGSCSVFAFSKFLDRSGASCCANILAWMGRNSIALFVMHGACGACRATWGLGLTGYVLEYLLLALVTYLLSEPLHFFISPQKYDGQK